MCLGQLTKLVGVACVVLALFVYGVVWCAFQVKCMASVTFCVNDEHKNTK